MHRLSNVLTVTTLLVLARSALAQDPRFRHLDGGNVNSVFFYDGNFGVTAEDGCYVASPMTR